MYLNSQMRCKIWVDLAAENGSSDAAYTDERIEGQVVVSHKKWNRFII